MKISWPGMQTKAGSNETHLFSETLGANFTMEVCFQMDFLL